jgi:hypothetical protein
MAWCGWFTPPPASPSEHRWLQVPARSPQLVRATLRIPSPIAVVSVRSQRHADCDVDLQGIRARSALHHRATRQSAVPVMQWVTVATCRQMPRGPNADERHAASTRASLRDHPPERRRRPNDWKVVTACGFRLRPAHSLSRPWVRPVSPAICLCVSPCALRTVMTAPRSCLAHASRTSGCAQTRSTILRTSEVAKGTARPHSSGSATRCSITCQIANT